MSSVTEIGSFALSLNATVRRNCCKELILTPGGNVSGVGLNVRERLQLCTLLKTFPVIRIATLCTFHLVSRCKVIGRNFVAAKDDEITVPKMD